MRYWPNKLRWRIIWVAAISMMGIAGWWWWPSESQPEYAGKRILDYFPGWVVQKSAKAGNPGVVSPQAGRIVLRPMFFGAPPELLKLADAKAMPWLLRVIRREDSLPKRFYLRYENRVPGLIRKVLPAPIPAGITRQQASHVLLFAVERDPEAGFAILHAALRQGSNHERIAAAQLIRLTTQNQRSAERALADNLSYPDRTVRDAAFSALLKSEVREAATAETMAKWWNQEQSGLDAQSYLFRAERFSQILARFGSKMALPVLAALRTNASVAVQVEATFATWRVVAGGDADCARELLRQFGQRTSEREGRYRAGRYLAQNRDILKGQAGEVVPIMKRILAEEEDWSICVAAAEVLAQFNGDALPALPELRRALRDDDRQVRSAAAQAIAAIGVSAAAAIPELLQALSDPIIQAVAARTLGTFGPAASPAIPSLVELVSNPSRFAGSSQLRSNAARALGQIGVADSSALTALRKAREDSDFAVREAAVEALDRRLSPKADKPVSVLE